MRQYLAILVFLTAASCAHREVREDGSVVDHPNVVGAFFKGVADGYNGHRASRQEMYCRKDTLGNMICDSR